MIEVKDEILNGEALFRLLDKNGNIIYDDIKIEMITSVIQQPTPLNKALFDALQNDIYKIIDEKTTFLLGEVEALEDCQQLSIENLDIQKNEEIFVVFRTRNQMVGSGSSAVYTLKINNTGIFSEYSNWYDCIAFLRLTSASDVNYYTSSILSSSYTSKSVQTVDTKINTISIVGANSSSIKKGNSLLVFKRTL